MGERSPRNQYSSCWACAMCPVVAMDEDSVPPPENGEPSGRPQASGDPQGSGDQQGNGDLPSPPRSNVAVAIWGGGGGEPYPALIRIGPLRYNCVYLLVTNSPLYQCVKASEWGGINDRRWLFRDWSGSLP